MENAKFALTLSSKLKNPKSQAVARHFLLLVPSTARRDEDLRSVVTAVYNPQKYQNPNFLFLLTTSKVNHSQSL